MNNYHRIYAKINLNAVKHNIQSIKSCLPQGTKLMAIVKADAYGHGAVEVSRAVNDLAYGFGVATIEEAIELRQNGIKKPVLILGTLSEHHFEDAVNNEITVAVFTEKMAKALSLAAQKLGKKALAHIAADTGMNRIGVHCNEEGILLCKKILSYPYINFEGIFSHFATADEECKAGTLKQIQKFDNLCKELEKCGVCPPLKHICNSAGICDFPDVAYSMVRPGIILYGLYPSDKVSLRLKLKPALELKSHVSHIKRVPAGEGISYGHTFVTDSERIIATVPVGYADGYPRLLSGKGRVIINGKYAPIVGRVCMDQFMVDITDIGTVNIEDTVTLIGTDANATITADEVAGLCNTISYEIVCGISKRVPRIYE